MSSAPGSGPHSPNFRLDLLPGLGRLEMGKGLEQKEHKWENPKNDNDRVRHDPELAQKVNKGSLEETRVTGDP